MFGLAEPVLRGIAAEGYTIPTPIQNEVIPAIMAGQDVLGIAQTGTGKTAAFVLPLIEKIISTNTKTESKFCRFLILTPTRELASQIAANIRAYGQFTKISVAEIVGGVKPGPQIRALAQGADIVVATPGRLEDHVRTGALKLSQVNAIVLDEADQMLDLGFAPVIRRIISKLPKTRQTILLSATMPKQIHKLATDLLTDPVEISVTPVSRPIERIDQTVLAVETAAKRDSLLGFFRKTEVDRAIVFTRTKRGADKVNRFLGNDGLATAVIHGNKSQAQRERALKAFRDGNIKILIATDIAARGIDVDDVSHVVNYDLPEVSEVYVHRIGRTARAGKSGIAISICTPEDVGLLRGIEKLIGKSIPLEDKTDNGLSAAPETTPSNSNKRSAKRGSRDGQKPQGTPSPTNRRKRSRKPQNGSRADGANSGLERMLNASNRSAA
jgi:ATP-dependent RNA helicase RhlE